MSTILGLLLTIIGISGTASIYRPRYPKIMSRLIIGSIAFVWVFPFLSEGVLFLVKMNSTGISSVAFSKKDNECTYRMEEQSVEMRCQLKIYNYGKEQTAAIRPLFDEEMFPIEIEPSMVLLEPHSGNRLFLDFRGKMKDDHRSSGSGTLRNSFGVEIEVNGVKRRYE